MPAIDCSPPDQSGQKKTNAHTTGSERKNQPENAGKWKSVERKITPVQERA